MFGLLRSKIRSPTNDFHKRMLFRRGDGKGKSIKA